MRKKIFLAVLAVALLFATVALTTSGQSQEASRPDIKLQKLSKPDMQKPEIVPGSYIVTLKSEQVSYAKQTGVSIRQMADDLAVNYGGVATAHYEAVLQGFAVEISDEAAKALALDSRVEAVYPVVRMYLAATQTNAPWHLDRIDQRDLPLNTQYNFNFTGAGVHAFVIDTGLRATHQEFTGRVGQGLDTVGDGQGTNDCGGHGTFVSGIVGGSTYGVAKGVTIHPIRVFGCDGGTTNTRVISGLDFAVRSGLRPAVVNMSLKGGPDPATDTAIRNATAAGVVVVVAAGNGNDDACNGSPSREPTAITVGASTRTDSRAGFSSFGTCVDLFAPGEGLTSSAFNSDTATTTASGTSASSPVVAGAVALFQQQNPNATAAQVQQAVIDNATTGRLSNIGTGSPNRLLFSLFPGQPTNPNLALNKPATGSTPCNSNEGPAKAVNGSVTGGLSDKFCSSAATKFLQVDLGQTFNVNQFIIKHAGAGGESTSFNTRDFNIQVSTNGTNFTPAVNVTGNTANVTTHNITVTTARFVRLNVTGATQSGGGATRIYELEVYGSGGNLALNKPATGSTPCNSNEGPAKAVNGSVTGGNSDKFCSLAATKFLQVDLGQNFNITSVVVRHAGAGGESSSWNTRDFDIMVSTNGTDFTLAAAVRGNTSNVTTNTINPAQTARFVRLNIITPASDGNTATRIYELEVFGGGGAGLQELETRFIPYDPYKKTSAADLTWRGLNRRSAGFR